MKNKLVTFSMLFLLTASLGACKQNTSMGRAEEDICYVDFFNNYKREDFTLSDGFSGKGNNLLYLTVEVSKGSLVSKPEDPTRKNYDFAGWYTEEECVYLWDFDNDKCGDLIYAKDIDNIDNYEYSGINLYAKWEKE